MGDLLGVEFQSNTTTIGSQAEPAMTTLADGGFVITWRSANPDDSNRYDLYGQRYSVSGEPIGNEFQINSTVERQQADASITGLPDGGFVVTWHSEDQDGSGHGVYGQRFNEMGERIGDEFQINTYTESLQTEPSVTALTNGDFVVTWESFGQDGSAWGVYGQRFNAAGQPAGDEFRVNSATASTQENPAVAALEDGSFVITWNSFNEDGSGSDIRGQRFDADGQAIGQEFLVNTYTESNQVNPSVTGLKDGSFVVTWESFGQDGSAWGVYGQRFGDDGQPLGEEFQVNSSTLYFQENPVVAALDDGGFVVAWQSLHQKGDVYDIYAQRFNADGQPVGEEFRVNSYTASMQTQPDVIGLDDGGFIIAWQSHGQNGDNWDIYGKRFDAEGNPIELLQNLDSDNLTGIAQGDALLGNGANTSATNSNGADPLLQRQALSLAGVETTPPMSSDLLTSGAQTENAIPGQEQSLLAGISYGSSTDLPVNSSDPLMQSLGTIAPPTGNTPIAPPTLL